MNTAIELDKYSAAVGQLKSHIELNKAVFDTHEQLVFKVMDAENQLRDAVAEAGAGVSNGRHSVTCIPQTQTFADIEELDKAIADLDTMDDRGGNFMKTKRATIVKTVSRPPRITISEVK